MSISQGLGLEFEPRLRDYLLLQYVPSGLCTEMFHPREGCSVSSICLVPADSWSLSKTLYGQNLKLA